MKYETMGHIEETTEIQCQSYGKNYGLAFRDFDTGDIVNSYEITSKMWNDAHNYCEEKVGA